MELAHYTDGTEDVAFSVYDRDQGIRSGNMKPRGLWVSTEGPDQYGWIDWCVDNDWGIDGLRNRYVVELADNANILTMSTSRELSEFTEKYGFLDPIFAGLRSPLMSMREPDWERVAADYDGIIISPYVWASRLDLMWYYGWDCASGCIWRASAIKSVTRDHDYRPSDALVNSPDR